MTWHRRRGPAAALAALLAASGLAACSTAGGGSSDGAGGTLHVLVGANAARAEAQQAWFAKLQKDFKAKTGADVVFDTFASAGDEQTKIQTSIVSGNGPDVFQLGTTFTPVAYATGGFHVLSAADWQRIGGRDKFLPASLAMAGPDQQHEIGVPSGVRPYGMVYNTELFKTAGITAPPRTWDELVDDARKLTKPEAGVYGAAVDYADGYDPWKYIWTFTLQSGGRLVNDDLTKAQLNSDQVAAAVDHFLDLRTKYQIVDPASAGWKAAQATAAFTGGKAAMIPLVGMPGLVPTLESSPIKGSYAFAPMPLIPFGAPERPAGGLAAGSIVSGDNLAVAGYSKHTGLALDFIALVTSPEEQKFGYQQFGDLPSNAAAAKELAAGSPQAAAFLTAETASVPTSFTGAWSDIQLGLGNVITQLLPSLAQGGYDPAAVRQALDKANQTAQSSLNRQKH